MLVGQALIPFSKIQNVSVSGHDIVFTTYDGRPDFMTYNYTRSNDRNDYDPINFPGFSATTVSLGLDGSVAVDRLARAFEHLRILCGSTSPNDIFR